MIRHTQLFIVLFSLIHFEDDRRKRPKHAGVINKHRL
jgi:hypothetical protein